MKKIRVVITRIRYDHSKWLRGKDLNQRPPGYEPDELPAALPRDIDIKLFSTPGLSFGDAESRLAVTRNCRAISTAAVFALPLHPPQAAGERESQRAALVGMTRRRLRSCPSKKKSIRWMLSILVAGEGFEPTTSGL